VEIDLRNRHSVPWVATELRVSRVTVFRWIREGRLPAVRIGGGGYRIHADDIARLISTQGAVAR
jgi:excisionase family DNA binding protein